MNPAKEKAPVKQYIKNGSKVSSVNKHGAPATKINGHVNHKIKNASMKEFSLLKDMSGYSNDQLAALVGTTHRTIRNKKNNGELFDIAQTERLRKLSQLFKEGNEIFHNNDQFNEWLQKPSYSLDYIIPAELLQEPGGLDKVMNELISIKYGDTI